MIKIRDVVDLVVGYFTLKKLKEKGYLKEGDLNISFTEFIIRSVKAIRNIDRQEEVNNEIK